MAPIACTLCVYVCVFGAVACLACVPSVCVTTPRKSVALSLQKQSICSMWLCVWEQHVSVMRCSTCVVACSLCASDGATSITDFCHLPSEPCLAPTLEQHEQVLAVALGQPVRQCCGRTERGGHWYKEGSRLASAGRVRGWRGRLEIASFFPEDAGQYLCLARGSMTVLHNLTLIVVGKSF